MGGTVKSHQSKCSAPGPSPCCGTPDTSYRCLCVQFFMSSPSHHLSYRRLRVHICFQARVNFLYVIYLILRCPSSHCIPHAIIKCPMTILFLFIKRPSTWAISGPFCFFLVVCRHTASPEITSGTHTGGVPVNHHPCVEKSKSKRHEVQFAGLLVFV